MKAQMELIVIAGLILVFVVVAFYAMGGLNLGVSPVPAAVYEEQKDVAATLDNVVREAAGLALERLESQGGYAGGPGAKTVTFRGQEILMWGFCQNPAPPSSASLRQQLEGYIEGRIRQSLAGLSGLYARNVSFDAGALSVQADITDTQVMVTVGLPTEVGGYAMQSPLYPYKVVVPSDLGRIYRFARDYVMQNSNSVMSSPGFGRFMETYTIGALYFSAADPKRQHVIPTTGILTECGDAIHRSPNEIDMRMKEAVEFVLSHMLWWQNLPVAPSGPKVPAIQSVSGNVYHDLRPELYLPDGFAFDLGQYVHLTNLRFAHSGSPMPVPICINRFHVGYDVPYPYVVSVRDDLTGNDFNFAVYAYVEDRNGFMYPGECNESIILSGGQPPCEHTGCSASMTVRDGGSRPVQGASVSFGGCGLGVTDDSGSASGEIGCGEAGLVIYKAGYDAYVANVTPSGVNATFTLLRLPNVTMRFSEVRCTQRWSTGDAECFLGGPPLCTGEGCQPPVLYYTMCEADEPADVVMATFAAGGEEYPVTNLGTSGFSPSCGQDPRCDECRTTGGRDACSACASSCTGGAPVLDNAVNVGYVPAQPYTVTGESLARGDYTVRGGLADSFTLPPDATDVYVYMPDSGSTLGYSISDAEKARMSDRMKEECGIGPVSGAAYQSRTLRADCESCAALKEAAGALEGLGCGIPDTSGMFQDCNCINGECGICCDGAAVLAAMRQAPGCGVEVSCA
jgi:hypothetical protein